MVLRCDAPIVTRAAIAIVLLVASSLIFGAACALGAAYAVPPVTTQAVEPQSLAIVGVWILDPGSSDAPPVSVEEPGRSGRGRDGGGRGRGRGGFGGGFGGRRGPGAGGPREPDEARVRQMEAIRDLLDAPERLTITATESMVIVTSADGRTTRLATDGTGVKDESTGITRSTRWESGRLVSRLTGLPRGKATESYSVDPDGRQLTVTMWFERRPGPARRQDGSEDEADAKGGRTFTRTYRLADER